jgi:hypothetical protein
MVRWQKAFYQFAHCSLSGRHQPTGKTDYVYFFFRLILPSFLIYSSAKSAAEETNNGPKTAKKKAVWLDWYKSCSV